MSARLWRNTVRTSRLGLGIVVGILSAGASIASAAEAGDAWSDPSPHVEGFVTTSAGRLHYLDWGGSGETVVLLAGLGNTAHVFDEFAPRLTRSFRVIGLTRRGFGASARPSSGYDTDTLAGDLGEALDALGLARVNLVGHSLAGDEITRFAGLHPDRVGAVVYLDAAYDRAAMRRALALSLFTNPKPPSPPRPGGRDKASVAAYSDYLQRIHGARWPQAEVRATGRFGRDGRYAGASASASTSAKAMLGVKPPDYGAVQAPALAIYAIQDTVGTAYPWLGAAVPKLNAWNWLTGRWRPFAEAEREKFLARVPDATVVELQGPHYIFLSHPDEVASRVRFFVTGATQP